MTLCYDRRMLPIETSRLILVPTPLHVLEARIDRESFRATLHVGDRSLDVQFPPEWPGEALVLFPELIQRLRSDQRVPWGGTIIERAELVAIGQMSFKDLPDEQGAVEIGYGINPGYQRRGYATEMARALVGWALAQPDVRVVTAECRIDNIGSIRVLKNSGFQPTGERVDPDEGPLILWRRTG